MKLFRLECLVFVVASMILSWNLGSVGIASGDIDPIRHLGAQDEATYTREAITMAREGGWMTPTFLGRWVFEKPPLLMWLSAASMRTFGIGRVTARLPAILAGALLCALCFAMVSRERSLYAGLAAAAMALSSQILFTMSRHNMTDILFAAAGMCAFAILLRDPDLRSSANLTGFVIAASAGIMAKSIAGILVLAVMVVFTGFARKRWARASLAFAAAVALASPWFLYNFILHRDWLLADMGFQIIIIGTSAHQTVNENHVWFYIVRILRSDLLPLLLTITASPALVRAVRKREPAGVLAISYFAIYLAALMLFHFHSEQYLCWFVPSLILIGALYSPLMTTRGAIGIFLVALIVFIATFMPPVATIPAAPALSRYCTEHRATDLYVFGINDEFYSGVLPLHCVRYGFIDPAGVVAREHPHLAYLGLLIPATELAQVDAKLPVYRDRLRAWGLELTKAVATGIFAHDAAALVQIIHDHPESDFLVARSILADPEHTSSHHLAFANKDFALLESKLPVATESPGWSCEM